MTSNIRSSGYEPSKTLNLVYKDSVSTARQCNSCLVDAVSCMGVSQSSSSTAGDSVGEDSKPFAPSTPTPQNRGGLFRTPSNTTLAVESTTATKRRRRGKAAAAPVPSEPRKMDDGAREASSDVEARRPTHSEQQSKSKEEEEEEEEEEGQEEEDMTVKEQNIIGRNRPSSVGNDH
jgi:hypothetical protein